jgi:hypothetical protein
MSDFSPTDKEKLLQIVNKLQAFIDDPEEHFFYTPIKENMRSLDTQKVDAEMLLLSTIHDPSAKDVIEDIVLVSKRIREDLKSTVIIRSEIHDRYVIKFKKEDHVFTIYLSPLPKKQYKLSKVSVLTPDKLLLEADYIEDEDHFVESVLLKLADDLMCAYTDQHNQEIITITEEAKQILNR